MLVTPGTRYAGRFAATLSQPRALQEKLHAAEQRERLAGLVLDLGVPNLRRSAAVDEAALAADRPLERRREEVRLQLDRGEARPAFGQAAHAAPFRRTKAARRADLR